MCILNSLESTLHTPNHTAGTCALPKLGHSSQSKLRQACVAPMPHTYALHHMQNMPMDVSHLLVSIKLKPYHYQMRCCACKDYHAILP